MGTLFSSWKNENIKQFKIHINVRLVFIKHSTTSVNIDKVLIIKQSFKMYSKL